MTKNLSDFFTKFFITQPKGFSAPQPSEILRFIKDKNIRNIGSKPGSFAIFKKEQAVKTDNLQVCGAIILEGKKAAAMLHAHHSTEKTDIEKLQEAVKEVDPQKVFMFLPSELGTSTASPINNSEGVRCHYYTKKILTDALKNNDKSPEIEIMTYDNNGIIPSGKTVFYTPQYGPFMIGEKEKQILQLSQTISNAIAETLLPKNKEIIK